MTFREWVTIGGLIQYAGLAAIAVGAALIGGPAVGLVGLGLWLILLGYDWEHRI